MDGEAAAKLIDALGGNGAVSRMTKSPAPTVHGWRRVGLSAARLDHLELAAHREGKAEQFARAVADHVGGDA